MKRLPHTLLITLLLWATLSFAAVVPVDQVVRITTGGVEGIEFRTSVSMLLYKTADGYKFNGTLPTSVATRFKFDSGATIELTQQSDGFLVKLSGAPSVDPVLTDRGWRIRWNIKGSAPSTGSSKATKDDQINPSIEQQAAHFINLLRGISGGGSGVSSITEQAQTELLRRNFPAAIKLFEQAAKDSNTRSEAYLGISHAYREQGDSAQYKKYWELYRTTLHSSEGITDSVVPLESFKPPPLWKLPALNLPPDLLDLKLPIDTPKTDIAHPATMLDTSKSEHVIASTPHDTTPHHEPVVVAQPAEPVIIRDTVFMPSASTHRSGFGTLAIVASIAVTFVLTVAGFLTLQKLRDRKRVKALAAEETVTPVARPPKVEVPTRSAPPASVVPPAPAAASAYAEQSYSGLADEDDVVEEDDPDDKRRLIYEMDDSGLSILEIAQRLGMGQDEVRTYLSLRRV